MPKKSDKIGFVLSTKDRVDFTLQCLKSMDCEEGFDIIWMDGSETEDGKKLPYEIRQKKSRIKEIFLDVKGGGNATIRFGLGKLLELGYEYCGLIENDVVFQPNWFTHLLETFRYAARDKLIVGAATVRNYVSRVLEFRNGYTVNWNIGSGMTFFTRKAAETVLNNFPHLAATTAGILFEYFGKTLGIDLQSMPEWQRPRVPAFLRIEPPDWTFQLLLYNSGMVSIGSIPSFAYDLDYDVSYRGTRYVTERDNNSGLNYPPISTESLHKLRSTSLISEASLNFFRMPKVYRIAQRFLLPHFLSLEEARYAPRSTERKRKGLA